ncbi:MAG: hypothetical protein LBE31_09910 [Deltaproteobacteria bacterium]|jgi:hypothetical protein|nr:hypothetical protein [Deltaproteobacteria bacterium]
MEDWEKKLALEKFKLEEQFRFENSRRSRHHKNLLALVILLIMTFLAFFILYRLGQARLKANKSVAAIASIASIDSNASVASNDSVAPKVSFASMAQFYDNNNIPFMIFHDRLKAVNFSIDDVPS